MMTRREEYRALALTALIAAVFLLFFSRCSPLYPTNSWGEANAFFTVGRSMLAGKVPYRDLCLGAGPMVYAIHALAACISDTSFLGVWLLEIVALTGLLFFSWRTAARISGMPALSMGMAALMALLLASSQAFISGDTVEEFALPLQAFAVCDLLAYMDDPERKLSTYRLVLHGFLAGCVFWMKYTLIGVHLAFIGVIAVDAMMRQRKMRGAAWMCLDFAAGAVIATAPWIAYYGANGALKELYALYMSRDWSRFAETVTPLRSTFAALASAVIRHPHIAAVMLLGGGFLLRRLVHRRWNACCTAAVVTAACAIVIAWMDGERYRFMPMAAGVFLMLCAGPLALLMRHAWRQRRAYTAAAAAVLLACAGYGCLTNGNLPYIGYPAEELPQVVFAKHIEENGGGELFTYRIEDNGFYLAAGQIPQRYAFAKSEAYRGADWSEQQKAANYGGAEWIISRSSNEPGGSYAAAKTASSPYDRFTSSGGGTRVYYLYRRLDK